MEEILEFDILIIGAGPAGLSAAIRLKQLANQEQRPLRVCVLEKGAEVGAHILSGAVIEPRALQELFPDWETRNAPLHTPVTQDAFYYLTAQKAWKLPTPQPMHNRGNYIVSLGNVCRWLAQQAELLGVEIFPGFAAKEALFDNEGKVIGVRTTEMGVSKQGEHKANYQAGIAIHATWTLIAEGAHGSIAKQLIQHFQLRKNSQPQTYGIGIKELWQVPKANPGQVIHTIGWPLDSKTYGGSFIYHLSETEIALGFVVGLDYENPYLSPWQELQRFKHHPFVASMLKEGQLVSYGARALNEGGFQSIPQLSFPGGLLIGCSAGFLNVPKIKGSHTAMKSGMLAAEAVFAELKNDTKAIEINHFNETIKKSWIGEELYRVRNIRPAFQWGLWAGLSYAAIDTYLFKGKTPWTFSHHRDHTMLKNANACAPIHYPKPDNRLSFDQMTLVRHSNTNHEEDQLCHLQIQDREGFTTLNLKTFAGPETRYCPAGVYEYVNETLKINAQNCVHCKTCDIKDPGQNINWTVPEGGGPNYPNM